MKPRTVATLAVGYFLAMAIALTYPGYLPANRIRPLVFGLPFSLFWQMLWISGSIAVLGLVFAWEKRRRTRRERGERGEGGEGGEGGA
ncbi:MAG: DUF3311 domain-containing protein [Candidatus Palauibacterales bacterium]|nr:DUF3311 domain-containing protein [Candidatus Palauibacterales bacterium]